jgi:signal transduction histidine kinase
MSLFPMRPSGASYTSRAIRDGMVMNVADALAETDPEYATKPIAKLAGYRSVLSVPMFRGRQVLGAISVNRAEVGLFADKEVELLRTFADQAVIAIENVRLFNETREALEQQKASADVLQVISGSMADAAPVFEKILDTCQRVLAATDLGVFLVEGGDRLSAAAWRGAFSELVSGNYPRALAGTMSEAVMRQGMLRHWPDVEHSTDVPGYIAEVVRAHGNFSVAVAPLMWEGRGIGTLDVMRKPPRPYSDKELTLLQTFAEQAVIAIENARLFNALQDKTRELEIASRHKSAFLANMSHELRTPLNAILGFTRIVLRETRTRIAPKQAENLEKILGSARHLVGLINATLDLTRIEAGRIEITPSQLVLAPLLDECLRSVEPLCAEGVRLDARVAAGLPPLRVDVEKLHQILINLLGNAVKFTAQGAIELRAAVREDRIVVEVEDSGIGIAADKLEAVFEEFEQVDASHTRAHGGTGLGLAIARRLVRAMGGDLTAVSALGRGSTFTLNLPLRWKDADEA